MTFLSRDTTRRMAWRYPNTCPVRGSDPEDAVARFRAIWGESFGESEEMKVIGCRLREEMTGEEAGGMEVGGKEVACDAGQ